MTWGAIDHARLWSVVILHLWQTTLVVAAIWVLERGLRQAPARYQLGLWWVAGAKLLVPLPLVTPWMAKRHRHCGRPHRS